MPVLNLLEARLYEARRQRAAEPYFYASTVVTETPIISNDKQNAQPKFSPDGREIAFTEDRNNLRIYSIATKQTRTLLTDKELFGGEHYFQWSPDSKWILFNLDVPRIAPGEVGLARADGSGQVVNLTQSGFNDSRGKWILDGKAMLWFSNRDGLKSVAQSGGAQQDVYAMFFDRDAWEKSRLSKDDFALAKELGPDGIRVNCIQPGNVEGERINRVIEAKASAFGVSFEKQKQTLLDTTSLRTFVSAQDVANMALFLATSCLYFSCMWVSAVTSRRHALAVERLAVVPVDDDRLVREPAPAGLGVAQPVAG